MTKLYRQTFQFVSNRFILSKKFEIIGNRLLDAIYDSALAVLIIFEDISPLELFLTVNLVYLFQNLFGRHKLKVKTKQAFIFIFNSLDTWMVVKTFYLIR